MQTSSSRPPEFARQALNGDGADTASADAKEPSGQDGPAATPTPAAPLDDQAVFNRLMAVAQEAGRLDLVEEFRRRADGAANQNGAPAAAAPAQLEPATGKPVSAMSLVNDGLRMLKKNKVKEAVGKFQEAVARDPSLHEAQGNLGVGLARMKKLPEAERAFREAVRLRPESALMLGNLGTACSQQKKYAEAEQAFREAIRLDAKQGGFHHELGVVLEALKQPAAAEESYRTAIGLKPKHADTHFRLGKLLQGLTRPADAETCFREATGLQPDRGAYWNGLGGVLEAQNQSAAAEAAYRVAVGLEPKNAEFHNNMGVVLASANRLADAEACYRKALELAPKLAMAHNNLGNALRAQDRLEEATHHLQEAIKLQPKYAEAHNNLGIVHIQEQRRSDGMACYDKALKLRPDYPEAHLNRSLSWLAEGDYARGWEEYEWRFKLRNRKQLTDVARWDGSPLDGRTLLLHAEQGLGDTVQFIRYASLIPRGSGGAVVLDCPESLADLARTCPGIDRVVPRGKPLEGCDVSIPLLSIPGVLGTRVETIPGDVPYLSADPERVEFWRQEVERLPGRRIGIVWQGSQEHKGDKMRSVTLAQFAALGRVRGVNLCSLQKGPGAEQLTDGTADGMIVYDFGLRTQPSFADCAALMKALDLVVTVDTSVAHVAGAMGIPIWVALPFASDWRWLTQREDTPWYPTMRLFRQPRRGGWEEVFSRMAQAIEMWPDRLRGMPAKR